MTTKEHLINDEIKSPHVRLILSDGEMKGIVNLSEALFIAEDEGLDLVEIQPQQDPPICKIMDYGKFCYSTQKKQQLAQKKQKIVKIKDMKFTPFIGQNDYNIKIKQIKTFLNEGKKVRIIITTLGLREKNAVELSNNLMGKIILSLSPFANLENNEIKHISRDLVFSFSPLLTPQIKPKF